jgi:TrpR-related protein YerC/YecD
VGKPPVELFEIITKLENRDESWRFFCDLCTPAEINSMIERWRVAQLLNEGHSYRQINEMTGVSTATITRVAKFLRPNDSGYRMVLAKNN